MKKKFFWIGLLGTLVLATVAVAYFRTEGSRTAAAGLQEAKDEAKDVGLALTMKELATPDVPADQGAGDLIEQAIQHLAQDKDAAADLMNEAATRPALGFSWEQVAAPGFWETVKFQECLTALLDSAQKKLEAGDFGEFRRRMNAAFALARRAGEYPTTEAFAASVHAERLCYERLGGLMVARPADRQLMPVVQAQTFEKRNVKTILAGLRYFVVQGQEIARARELDGDQKVKWLWSTQDFPGDPWGRDAVEATHLKESVKLIKEVDKAPNWPSAANALAKYVDAWSKSNDPTFYSLKALAPTIERLAAGAAENEAARRILFVAAGAYRWRHEKGSFPPESPIKGEMELDPFTLKPMGYANPGTGFYVYSIGSDGLDSSGTDGEGLVFGLDVGFNFTRWPIDSQSP